jgi:hypothetical protein
MLPKLISFTAYLAEDKPLHSKHYTGHGLKVIESALFEKRNYCAYKRVIMSVMVFSGFLRELEGM